MKNIGIYLATALMLLNVAAASAGDLCSRTQAMCPVGTVQLAAYLPIKPATHSRHLCIGQVGVDLKRCLCKLKGTDNLPCHLSGSACLCQ